MSLGPPKTHWAVSPLNALVDLHPRCMSACQQQPATAQHWAMVCHPIWKHKIKLGINIIVLILLDMLIRLSDDICTHEKHQSLWQGVNTWGYAFIRNPRTLTTDKALPHTFTCPAKNPTDPTVDGGNLAPVAILKHYFNGTLASSMKHHITISTGSRSSIMHRTYPSISSVGTVFALLIWGNLFQTRDKFE